MTEEYSILLLKANIEMKVYENINIYYYDQPDERMDPWKEALNCYKDFADEVIITGQDWPEEFTWDHIGKTFQQGLEKSSGDWCIRMDLDYFFIKRI